MGENFIMEDIGWDILESQKKDSITVMMLEKSGKRYESFMMDAASKKTGRI
jgi:hypothetical protein